MSNSYDTVMFINKCFRQAMTDSYTVLGQLDTLGYQGQNLVDLVQKEMDQSGTLSHDSAIHAVANKVRHNLIPACSE